MERIKTIIPRLRLSVAGKRAFKEDVFDFPNCQSFQD